MAIADLVGLILAAGNSSRFGKQNKLLHSTGNNPPLGLLCAQKIQKVILRTLVVCRSNDIKFQTLCALNNIPYTANKRAEMGMSTSIVTGVEQTPDAKGWIIFLADMPYIQTQTIRQVLSLIDTSRGKIIVPTYNGLWGHPVAFSNKFKQDLLALKGDVGARSIIQQNRGDVLFCEVNDEAILLDIDCKKRV